MCAVCILEKKMCFHEDDVQHWQTHLQSSTLSYYGLFTRIVKVTRGGERILPPMPNFVGDLGKWTKECQAELQELLELEIDHVVIF